MGLKLYYEPSHGGKPQSGFYFGNVIRDAKIADCIVWFFIVFPVLLIS